jgi:carbamoyl-phosphate synthase large subunit
MNILLSAVGRRTYLVRQFQQALQGRGKVIALDTNFDSPAMLVADERYLAPPAHDPAYVDWVLALALRTQAGLICSLHDVEGFVLAQHRQRFVNAGIQAILPSHDWARLCLDKLACGVFLRDAGFEAPWTSTSLTETAESLAKGDLNFPLVIKARLGFGSLALAVCQDWAQLVSAYHKAAIELGDSPSRAVFPLHESERVLIQSWIAGKEYRMELLHDLKGRYASHFICELHQMRFGESESVTTRDPDLLNDLPHRLSKLFVHNSIWGLDLIWDGEQAIILDINPRFTGAYPFCHLAGANVPAALVAWAMGQEAKPEWLRMASGIRGVKIFETMEIDRWLEPH